MVDVAALLIPESRAPLSATYWPPSLRRGRGGTAPPRHAKVRGRGGDGPGYSAPMLDSLDGFAFSFVAPDIHGPGGMRRRRLLVIAQDIEAAREIARYFVPHAEYEARGPDILSEARALGVDDNYGRLLS